jgi:hypothetical protein
MSRPSSCLTSHPPGLDLRSRGFDAAEDICGGLGSFLSYGLLNKFALYVGDLYFHRQASKTVLVKKKNRTLAKAFSFNSNGTISKSKRNLKKVYLSRHITKKLYVHEQVNYFFFINISNECFLSDKISYDTNESGLKCSIAIEFVKYYICMSVHFFSFFAHALQKRPEALKSLYRSPGNKKNQLVQCKNYVLQW